MEQVHGTSLFQIPLNKFLFLFLILSINILFCYANLLAKKKLLKVQKIQRLF